MDRKLEKNEIMIFDNQEVILEIEIESETIWLSQKSIAKLFGVGVPAISKHLKKIFETKELIEEVVVSKKENTTAHGAIEGKTQTNLTAYYNLDAIISVGYRVNSSKATQFRIWATNVLRNHLIKGYTINEKRLDVLNKTIEIQTKMLAHSMSVDVNDIDFVIKSYTNALSLLDDYDHQCVTRPIDVSDNTYELTYVECKAVIAKMAHYGTTDVFGVEKEKGKFEGILAAVYQQGFGIEMYPSIEEKAANLLYFLVKDHPFADGCKRIAATLFVHFLNQNNFLFVNGKQIISNSTLVAITIMIAESNPREKEIMVHLVMNILQERN